MKYNSKIVLAYFKEQGLPEPETEYKFHPDRKWRFDFAWVLEGEGAFEEYGVDRGLAMEVEGGVWISGRHSRGSGFVKDMEKYNEAAAMGWRVLRVQPKDLCTQATVNLVKRCLGL